MERLDIAIWYEGNSQEESQVSENSSEIEVHLNFWKLPKSPTFDVGVMFPIEATTLFVFFAGVDIDNNFICDITEKLEKENVRNLIFNDYTKTTSCTQKAEGFHIAKIQGNCWCYYTKKYKVDVSKKYGGTLVQIKNSPCHKCNTDNMCGMRYTRLRICGQSIKDFFSQNIDPKSAFQYFTTKYEMLDFRLNNVRSLPAEFIDSKSNLPKKIRRVRCFLICEAGEEVLRVSSAYKKLRSLEKDGWRNYIELNGNAGKLLAYQWNVDDENKVDYSLFAETRTSKLGVWRTLFLLFLAFLASVGASCISNLICQKLGWVCQ